MNPSVFVNGRITRLMHGLDDFLERDRELFDRAPGIGVARAAGSSR